MLKIRLTRTGKRGQAMYRIVVAEAAKRQGGKVVETLGWYNPRGEGAERFSMNMESYDAWVKKGAQPNDSVLRLVLTKEEKEQRWPAIVPEKAAPKKEEAVEEKATEAPKKEEAAPKKEEAKAPVEETKKEEKTEKAPKKEAKSEEKSK